MGNPWSITATELKEILQQSPDRITLVDVREEDEFAEGHLPNAKLIALSQFIPAATQALSKDSEVILYCAHGVRSLEALMLLKQAGFTKVRSLEGGYFEYIGE